jgi:hypothetical protein
MIISVHDTNESEYKNLQSKIMALIQKQITGSRLLFLLSIVIARDIGQAKFCKKSIY